MNTKTFSKKEAITRGIQMTKKYFGVILIVIGIYIAIGVSNGQLQSGAGLDRINKRDIKTLYKDSAAVDAFNQYLQTSGYINKFGKVQDKLEKIEKPSDLVLPLELDGDRYKIFRFLQAYKYHLPFPKAFYYVLLFGFGIINMLLQIGATKMTLMVNRDEAPNVFEIFSNGSLLITYILSSICYSLAVIGGMILLIVPGIILSIALGMNMFFIVDQKMGPIESLKASRALTKGVRWQLFCFGGALLLFNLAGLLCLVIGLLFTIPVSCVATAYVYDHLRNQVAT